MDEIYNLNDYILKVFQKLVLDCVKAPGLRFPQVGPMFSNMDPLAGTQPRELSRSPGPTFETLWV